jgi:hypothetical protein
MNAVFREKQYAVESLNTRRVVSATLLVFVLAVIFYPSFALGTVTLRITDSGARPGEPIYAKCSNIALHRAGEGEKTGWIELVNATGTYDLSSLGNVTETVLRSRITAGRYDKIRFKVAEASAVVNGSKVNLSIKQSVMTLDLELSIGHGEERIVLLDFKSNSTMARVGKVFESSPTVSVVR